MISKSKKHKLLNKVLAFALAVVMAVPNMSLGQVVAADDTSKIDVWDFGAEQLDTSVYNNMITNDEVNSWYSGVEAGTAGVNLASFTTTDGQLSFNDGGYSTTHRLRTTNESITRYDTGKYLVDANGTTYNGYIYSNKSASKDVYVSLQVTAGDIVTLAVGSNGGDGIVNFESPSGAVAQQTFVADATNGSKHAQLLAFYPTETGTYKIYYTQEKLVLGRIYRQHTDVVTVSGSVTAPAGLSDYSVVFTNKSSGAQTTAAVSNGAYSVSLNASYTYDVSLANANGYIITSAQELALTEDATFDVTVAAVSQVTVTGNITGLSAEALADLKLTFETTEIYKPEVVVSGSTYSVSVESGVTYTVVAEGINDYTLTSSSSVTYTEAGTADITFAAKPTYAITIAPEGATTADLATATFTFTNLNESGYVYTFTGTDNIALRDGTYSVKVTNSGIYVQQLTSNLTVNGAAVTKTIPFDGDVSSWDFSASDWAGTSPYNGLVFSNGQKNKTYLLSGAGTISVPVKGACQIAVSACYQYSFYFAADTEGSVGQKTGSTSQIDTFTYDYTGEVGTVDITVLGTSYITKIEVLDAVAYKDTVTVGATGCDYTTINDALDAVAAMPRPNNERVTIEIQPGNYEEMLVVTVPNVTLKNASTTPSIELTNKGVDIDANAVRITSYYGHGYTYYSMGSDCKYDENILKVNKENGYASFTNPGSGSTAGSYWNATVVISADGFEAEGIIFENSFNQYVSKKAANDVIVAQSSAKEPANAPRASLPEGSTAVQDKAYVERAAALAITNNIKEVSFDNCKFIGRQDTLYGGVGTTAAFYACDILGGTDYIFGGMTAVFAKCNLVFNTSENGNDVGYITAPQQSSGRGYLMYNCTVTSTTPGVDTASEYTSKPGYLGRPWATNTGEAVFYKTVIDASDSNWYDISPSLIRSEGWLNTLSGNSALCGEYGTYEMAKDVDNSASRAEWATVFTEEKLADNSPITVETFLGTWNPFAGKDMTIVMPTEKVDNAPKDDDEGATTTTKTYVLDTTTDLTAMSAGAKADGDTEKAGTDDYFTVIYSAKTKIDSSNKTFDDGYAASQRINFGGASDITVPKNAIQITTANPAATIKLWWVSGGDGREMAIYDSTGAIVAQTVATESVKNTLYISEFELGEAGTYYVGVPTGSNYVFKVEVTETAPAVSTEPIVNTLDATADLEAMAQGAKADGDIQVAGSNDYFTVIYSAKTKIDSSSKTFDDGYAASQRLNFGGATGVSDGAVTKNAVKFTTENPATVKLWWVSGGDGREMAIYDATGTIVAQTAAEESVKNSLYISELALDEAGTYYLGVPTGSNYVFKIEVTETPAASTEPEEFVLDATADLEAMAQGAKADGDTEVAGTDDFFTVIYSAKTKIDSSSKTFDDGYAASQRLNFGGATGISDGAVTKNAVKFTTENSATVKLWWVSGGDGREMAIYDATGTIVAQTAAADSVKNALYISELALDEAGTYYLGVPTGSNYVFKIQVTVAGSGTPSKPARADWATVAAPAITAAAQEDGDIKVTVSALVGYDGADEVVVTMHDAAGNEVASKRSIAEKGEHTLTFTPDASGTYTFKAVMNRENETAKEAAEAKTFSYVLPLSTPGVTSVTCLGGGKATVVWTAVDEAEKYVVSVEGTDITKEVAGTTATLEGLTIGETYTFKVVAVRGTENSAAGSMEWTIVDSAQRTWSFAAFGSGVNTTNNKATGSVYDGDLVVQSANGKGKLVPASTDGIAFYYTTIDPDTENFTLSADITVDTWTFSNGQEGFGMMAADAVGTHGDSTAFWNNSYMATVTKVEYYWDTETNSVSDSGDKYSMKLGIGAQEKTGVTADNLALFNANDTATVQNCFSSTMYPLETSAAINDLGAGTYNIAGNFTKDPGNTIANITTYHMEIQRNNTGYFITYTDAAGNSTTQKFYHGDNGDALTQIDKDNIYVGFFASRNAVISIDNVKLTTIAPEDDAPAEERPVTLVTPNYSVESSTNANSSDYELVFYANADGTLTIEGPHGTVVSNAPVTAETKTRLNVTLDSGKNNYKVTFTPDPNYVPGEYMELTSYDPVTINFAVTYQVNPGEIIYISPTGTKNGTGTKDDPMDIYTAVKYAAAGQKLYLMEGTYNLSQTVKVARGIDGTADLPIYLVADPEAETRPVLDFGGYCAGMVVAGDYWYLQGFDVTNSAPSQKGLQISGDYNTVDSVNAYRNGNTGIQISRYLSTDTWEDWPSNNLILNCTSYLNADPGYEDADGFAAKLTIADGNVFDGCIAAYNADDGWDLFAKVETGSIGAVTIKNCIAFKNGYDIDENGNEIIAGNGNGFKMGGDSLSGYHVLENSIAFANRAKGIDSNSCPDIQVKNSTAFNNGSYNVAFYTNTAANTDYAATGIISYKDANGNSEGENIKPKGTQDQTKIYGESNYYYPDGNSTGTKAADDWFVSLDTNAAINGGITRNADGTINMNGYLELTDKAAANAGADLAEGTPSANLDTRTALEVIEDAIEDVTAATTAEEVAKAIEDVLALPDSTWEGQYADGDLIKALTELGDKVEEKLQTTVGIENNGTTDLVDAANAILSIPAGENGTIVVTDATVPTRLPDSLANKAFANATAVDVKLTDASGKEVELQTPVVVQFERPSDIPTNKTLYVFCYKADGSVEVYDAVVKGDIVEATVSSFGTLVITNIKTAPAPGQDDSSVDTSATGTAASGGAANVVTAPTTSGKGDGGKKSPATDTLGEATDKNESTVVIGGNTDNTVKEDAAANAGNTAASDSEDGVLATTISNNMNWMLMLAGVAAVLFVMILFFYNKKEEDEN